MIDYLVTEAITLKAQKEDAAEAKRQEREQWKKEKGRLPR